MPYAQSALCHPDRQRKTAAGLCDTCYRRERSRADEQVRRRRIDATLRSRQRHPEEFDRRRRRQRALARGATISEPYTLREIAERDGWVCGVCRGDVDGALPPGHWMGPTIDHIVPFVVGGQDVRANVQLAHMDCNVRKGATVETSTTA